METKFRGKSLLPLETARLLSSFSYSSAANFSKYLYLKSQIPKGCRKGGESSLSMLCLWTKHLKGKDRSSWHRRLSAALTAELLFPVEKDAPEQSIYLPREVYITRITPRDIRTFSLKNAVTVSFLVTLIGFSFLSLSLSL